MATWTGHGANNSVHVHPDRSFVIGTPNQSHVLLPVHSSVERHGGHKQCPLLNDCADVVCCCFIYERHVTCVLALSLSHFTPRTLSRALTHLHTDPALFFRTAYGASKCPDDSVVVTNEQTCKNAASTFGKYIGKAPATSTLPGCQVNNGEQVIVDMNRDA